MHELRESWGAGYSRIQAAAKRFLNTEQYVMGRLLPEDGAVVAAGE